MGTMTIDSNDKYRLLLRLGRGGMAEVHVAVARGPAGFNKLVVVKRLLPAMASDDGFREMFMQEARLAARLNHPNIVQTYEVGNGEDGMYLAMEYLEGQPLSRLVRTLAASDQKLAVSTCIRIACDVLGGLHHAHELKDFDGTQLKVVHRDISPQNVFVTYLGQVKVLDFGIAKAERTSTKTQPGWLKGKYAYMAPEQFLGDEIDRRVDVFTTAAVLWELITGKQLFGGSNEAQTVKKVVAEPIPRLATEVPSIDPQLDAIVARALERDPKERFANALEMKEALEEVLARVGSTEDLGRVVTAAFKETRLETEQQISRLLGDSARLSTVGLDEMPSAGSLRAITANGPATAGASGFSHAGVAHTTATPLPTDADDAHAGMLTRGGLGMTGIIAAGAALVLATIVIARTVSGPAPSRTNDASSIAAAAAAPVPPPPVTARDARDAREDSANHGTAPTATTEIATANAKPSATHHATSTPPPPPRWSPPPQAAKPAVASATTPAAAPSPPVPPPASAPTSAPAAHEDNGNNTRRPAPASTPQEGRRFRTTL